MAGFGGRSLEECLFIIFGPSFPEVVVPVSLDPGDTTLDFGVITEDRNSLDE